MPPPRRRRHLLPVECCLLVAQTCQTFFFSLISKLRSVAVGGDQMWRLISATGAHVGPSRDAQRSNASSGIPRTRKAKCELSVDATEMHGTASSVAHAQMVKQGLAAPQQSAKRKRGGLFGTHRTKPRPRFGDKHSRPLFFPCFQFLLFHFFSFFLHFSLSLCLSSSAQSFIAHSAASDCSSFFCFLVRFPER